MSRAFCGDIDALKLWFSYAASLPPDALPKSASGSRRMRILSVRSVTPSMEAASVRPVTEGAPSISGSSIPGTSDTESTMNPGTLPSTSTTMMRVALSYARNSVLSAGLKQETCHLHVINNILLLLYFFGDGLIRTLGTALLYYPNFGIVEQ